jgi:hypothetical protein
MGNETEVETCEFSFIALLHEQFPLMPDENLLFQVQQAKEYVRRHEGQLQERLAQSKSTKDFMARFNLLLMRVLALGPFMFIPNISESNIT